MLANWNLPLWRQRHARARDVVITDLTGPIRVEGAKVRGMPELLENAELCVIKISDKLASLEKTFGPKWIYLP